MKVKHEYAGHHRGYDQVDAICLAVYVRLHAWRVNDHDSVDADCTQKPRAHLETRERKVADPATQEYGYVLQVEVFGPVAEIVLVESGQIPLVEYERVAKREYRQVAHTRMFSNVLLKHNAERGEIADGAHYNEHHRVPREDLLDGKVDALLAMLAKPLEILVCARRQRKGCLVEEVNGNVADKVFHCCR